MYKGLFSTKQFDEEYNNLVSKVTTLTPKEFLKEISNLYHQIESTEYDAKHLEIHQEHARIKRALSYVLKRRLKSNTPLTILDYGCGTGIPTLVIHKYLKSKNIAHQILAYDISQSMIDVLKDKIPDRESIRADTNLKQLLIDEKVDMIFCSSLLHHVPNIWKFINYLNSLLPDFGYLIIMHEPGSYNPTLQVQILERAYNGIKFGKKLFRKVVRKIKAKQDFSQNTIRRKHILDLTAEQALKLSITNRKLTRREIRGLVDIHTINAHPGEFNVGYNGFSTSLLNEVMNLYGFRILKIYHYDSFRDSVLNQRFNWLSYIFCKMHSRNAVRLGLIAEKKIAK